jgi:tRNA (guanine37-N1)-methyltransferase
MHFHVITLFPKMITDALGYGVVSQAIQNKKLFISTYDPRTWATDVHRAVDDRPFGGGDGMVMLPEALDPALKNLKQNLKSSSAKMIYLSARGKSLTDQYARELASNEELVLLCGRYGGVDQRFLEENNFEEVSIGDYVLSGGELGALVVIDSVSRHLPGVLGNATSAQEESFANGWLEYPQFTRPREWNGSAVPEILFSGNHAKIAEWRESLSILSTLQNRPDLLEKRPPTAKQLQRTTTLLSSLSEGDLKACGLNDRATLNSELRALEKRIGQQ